MASARRIIFGVILGLITSVHAADLPRNDRLNPAADEQRLAEIDDVNSVLFLRGESKVAAFRNMVKLVPSRRIDVGAKMLPLGDARRELGEIKFSAGDAAMTVNEYVAQHQVAGLLVIKNGAVVYERYGLGNNQDTLWVSFSVAKSVVSMLFGAAIKDGYIKSLEEKVTDYLPRLKGSSYDQATLRHILQMSSGVQWNEDYADPKSDVASASYDTLGLYEYLRNKPRVAPAGELFNYNTAETNLAGTVLRAAIGNNLSTYLSEKIWVPFGMEQPAYWQLTEAGGGEFGGCCINATLRDYARLGLFALNNGQLANGDRVLPEGWMAQSLAPSKGFAGYGYFWWLGDQGSYEASGIFGQGIYIDPQENVVIAILSAWPDADDESSWGRLARLYQALTAAVAQ